MSTDTIAAVLVAPDGTVRPVHLPAESDAQFTTLAQLLGCHAPGVVPLTSRLDLWHDDDALLTAPPLNHAATTLTERFGHRRYQPYLGTVVVTARGDDTSAMRSLPSAVAAHLAELVR